MSTHNVYCAHAYTYVHIAPYCATLQSGINESTFEVAQSLAEVNADCKGCAYNGSSPNPLLSYYNGARPIFVCTIL